MLYINYTKMSLQSETKAVIERILDYAVLDSTLIFSIHTSFILGFWFEKLCG